MGSLTDGSVAVIKGLDPDKTGGLIGLAGTLAALAGGVAGSIGLALGINGAIQAFNPQP